MVNPIELAVAPLKAGAIERAKQFAQATIDSVRSEFEAAGWDLNVVAPRPHANMSKKDYQMRLSRHNLFRYLTVRTRYHGLPGVPDIRIMSVEAQADFIRTAALDAADQYDSFVAKLISKVGSCDLAKLEGSHVWGCSFLTVVKGDTAEVWKTRQIINVSSLGKIFNQWPTRKVA